MIDSVPPGAVLMLGALLVPLLRGRVLAAYVVLLPVLSFGHLLSLAPGEHGRIALAELALTLGRVDRLSLAFGYVFHIAAFLSAIYAWHVRQPAEHAAGLIYAGAGIAGVFAGDLVTLFIWWEVAAISSVFLIWCRGTERGAKAGMRYLVIQVLSGVLLLAGAAIRYSATGKIAFEAMKLGDPGTSLIFLAFGIKCAFPFLHNWLQDAYPEATVTGTVFLSAFTTKLAVYALARGFPGTELLVPIGAAMTAFPIFYAVIENDLRRVLAYSLNNQLGFMVVGIGVGTEMSLNGTVSHAFCHILYKALLFMSMGAVLYRAGTINGSDLGGLYKSMPLTTIFCIVGAASISGFPGFSGFVSKSLILSGTAARHFDLTWFVLLFASAGVFHHSGIKIPFFAFFGHDSGIRCKEAPFNMLLAMGLAAGLCVFLGVYPGYAWLYGILPYKVEYAPYTTTHWVTQLQLLCLSALAFAVLKRTGLYPPELRATNLDTDWAYRRAPSLAWRWAGAPVLAALGRLREALLERLPRKVAAMIGPEAGGGKAPAPWPIGRVVIVSVLMLLAYLLVAFFKR